MRVRLASVAAALLLGVAVFAQTQERPARGTASATIDGKKVAIDYGRPALGGRTVEKLLAQLPADRMWRAGKDQVTTLTTEADLLIGGKKIPAGKYSLYVHCAESGEWSLAINSDQGMPLSKIWTEAPPNLANEPWPHLEGYQNIGNKEVARAPMKKAASPAAAEQFTITLTPAKDGAVMNLAWGESTWALDIKAAK